MTHQGNDRRKSNNRATTDCLGNRDDSLATISGIEPREKPSEENSQEERFRKGNGLMRGASIYETVDMRGEL
jgi:hypothetical protein